MLGLRQIGVVAHGRFSRRGFARAIEVAARGVAGGRDREDARRADRGRGAARHAHRPRTDELPTGALSESAATVSNG